MRLKKYFYIWSYVDSSAGPNFSKNTSKFYFIHIKWDLPTFNSVVLHIKCKIMFSADLKLLLCPGDIMDMAK